MANRLFLGKRGEDKMISIYWFFILFLVTAAVVYMVSLFYNHPYDVREIEVNSLSNKVADCISREGILTQDFFSEGKFNPEFEGSFFEICSITFDVEDELREVGQYYVGVDVYDAARSDLLEFSFKNGNLNLFPSCELKSEGYEKVSRCLKRRMYATSEGRGFLIEITTIVGKTQKNVRNV